MMTPPDPEPTASVQSRRLVAVVGSAVLAIGAMVVIFAMGVRGVPDYPTVAEQPEPPLEGRLAYIRWEDSSGGPYAEPCVFVLDIGGAENAVLCWSSGGVGRSVTGPASDVMPVWLEWDDDGYLRVGGYLSDSEVVVTIDVELGEEIGREERGRAEDFGRSDPPLPVRRDDGALVGTTWSDDGWAEVWIREPGAEQRSLVRDRGPDGYSFWNAGWSPGGDHVLVSDSERRTLVVSVTGDPAPRELVRDVDWVTWYQPS
jgi:hypothetical protein